jgi:hypothetical protein
LNRSTGDLISPPQGYNSGAGNGPEIAIDNSGNVWTGGDVTELNGSTGAPISPSTGYTAAGATFIAVDSSNNIWLTTGVTYSQPYGNLTSFGSVIKLNGTTGAPISPSTGYTAGGSLNPSGLAIDGSGNVWLANHTQTECTCENLIELNGSTGAVISGSTGYVGGGIINPAALAIDGSGNVWVANGVDADLYTYATSITEFVGAAAPVVTPQAVAVANHSIATRP